MQAEIKGKKLLLTVDMNKHPLPESKKGKTLIVARSDFHEKTDAVVDGKQVIVILTAYIYKEDA